MVKVLIKKLDPAAQIPSYKTEGASGMDLMAFINEPIKLKPKSSYSLSLKVLEYYSKFKLTKSSIIVGFGESIEEIEECMRDLINAGVSQLTIGQYLRPSPKHYPVKKTYSKEEFEMLKNLGLSLGFKSVVSGMLVRSSYYADKL